MDSDTEETRRRLNRLLWNPLVWAAVCLLIALPWVLRGAGQEFVPFVLTLVSGWCCGQAVVSATFAVQPSWRGAIVQVVVALALAGALYVWVFHGSEMMERLPEAPRRLLRQVQLAAIPGVTWIWFGIIARLTGAVRLPRRDPSSAPGRAAAEARDPEWRFEAVASSGADAVSGANADSGANAAVLRFTAIPMRLHSLGLQIAAIVLVGGAGAAGIAIVLHELSVIAGPRFLIVMVSVLVALPLYAVYVTRLKRRSVPCTVRVSRDRLHLRWGENAVQVRLGEIESLTWRCDSEYARVVVESPVRNVSLIAGLARVPQGVRPQLPPLPPEVAERLERAGMVREVSRRGVVRFVRAVTPDTPATPA